jgi:hypothetical protein
MRVFMNFRGQPDQLAVAAQHPPPRFSEHGIAIAEFKLRHERLSRCSQP